MYQISGRILVDFYGYAKHHKGLERQQPAENGATKESAYVRPLNSKEQQANKAAMLARNQDLMFLSPMLAGFALKDKLWRKKLTFDANEPSDAYMCNSSILYRRRTTSRME